MQAFGLSTALKRARNKLRPQFDQIVHDAYLYYHHRYGDYECVNEHLGFSFTRRPNDVSRHVLALAQFLENAEIEGHPLCIDERVAILRAIDEKFHSDRMPLILLGELLLKQGHNWEAFDAAASALNYDPYCEMAMSVLLATLRQTSIAPHWNGLFNRNTSPSVSDLKHDGSTTELLDYLIEFCRAVLACDSLDEKNFEAVRMFYHRWWKVYRHTDSRIGLFQAYGNSDQSQYIGALRHVIEFAAYRQLKRRGTDIGESETDWRALCCELALALEKHVAELPTLLLSADYLATADRLDEALDRGHRAFNTNSRCLLTQHVLDCVEDAQDRRSKQLPYQFSLLVETPRRFTGKFCNVPFDEAFINPDGDTFLCCAATLPVPVGNVFKENNWDRIWNSPAAQEVRRSILDGTYKYCNKRSCPAILNDYFMREQDLLEGRVSNASRKERWKNIVSDKSVQITDTLFADLGYDLSCNLSCPQCRLELMVLDKAGFAKLDATRDGIIDKLLANLSNVRITSGGEALFSKHFRKVLSDINPQACPNLTHLELLTNGMLFDRRQWEIFGNLHYLKILVVFSIDACSKETFEMIRRNGRWDKMLANLEFASTLRKQRKIAKFQISYAVQAANFREMPELVRMAERLHVDDVAFFKLENVGTYSEDDYRSRNVVEPSHPQHADFLSVIRDPVFASPIVNGHNLGPFFTAVHGPRQEREALSHDAFWGTLYP
jgi:MoaA/NifB/PqqE/SkfB family radical SAM enzyme